MSESAGGGAPGLQVDSEPAPIELALASSPELEQSRATSDAVISFEEARRSPVTEQYLRPSSDANGVIASTIIYSLELSSSLDKTVACRNALLFKFSLESGYRSGSEQDRYGQLHLFPR